MTVTTDEWKSELAKLDARQRAELARFLIESLDEQVDQDAEAAWEEELARRADEIRRGTAHGQPAEQAMDELREKHS